MKISFLHISDLHYRENWDEEIGLVAQKFIEDVATTHSRYDNLHLLFSGDLVFRGADKRLYDGFDTRFAKEFAKLGLPAQKRIVVPGNHDVSQDALKPLLLVQKGTLAEMRDERTFNDSVAQLTTTLFDPKFANYFEYEKRFADINSAASPGKGWLIGNEIGIYCLNTALCSFGGSRDSNGQPYNDQNQLLVDTRSLHRWLSETPVAMRILVMHHPLDWLAPWAKTEMEKIIADSFSIVFSGHIHEASTTYMSRGPSASAHIVAPPLFTRKAERLGYAYVVVDTDRKSVSVDYREWSEHHRFVTGSGLSGTDNGRIGIDLTQAPFIQTDLVPRPAVKSTVGVLTAEFEEAIISYTRSRVIWVERELVSVPETDSGRDESQTYTTGEFLKNLRTAIVRAPKQFGLTCLGRRLALEFHKTSKTEVLLFFDATTMPRHAGGIQEAVESRCADLSCWKSSIRGFILDNWTGDKASRRIVRELRAAFSGLPIIMLQSIDDCKHIADAIDSDPDDRFDVFYLWALTRNRIRELVSMYLQESESLDENAVTKKVIEDVDALNIHRTPMNCLMILRLLEQAFDDSPVNRTEMIGKVLFLLFHQFNKIPRYATRPDLKDCEYALGYFSEWLIRQNRTAFSKDEFYAKVREYCNRQVLDLEVDVLFSFLVSEHILLRKGIDFEFRFAYWLYFFAAHRMHHDSQFAQFILSNRTYSAYPEIIEFYAGIDRRRTDAVTHLAADLFQMNNDLLARTGIPADFNPFQHASWNPTPIEIAQMRKELEESVNGSRLPPAVKDRIADQTYDRSRPYNQELASFIRESSMLQLVQAMKGAARVLRNSDHVLPDEKHKLLQQVLVCWVRVCQVMALLSRALVYERQVVFEGMGFSLTKTFDKIDSVDQKWQTLMTVIPDNVVDWFQADLFSRKMGSLFNAYVESHKGEIGEALVIELMARQRPPGWEKTVERFIVREGKNSFYLNRVFAGLKYEFDTSFTSEKVRQDLRRLAAMAFAKHETGSKHPNVQLIEKAAKALHLENKRPSDNKGESLPEP